MTYRKQNNNQTVLGNILTLFCGALWTVVTLPFKRKKTHPKIHLVDRSVIVDKWIEVEHLANLGGESNGKNAILEADKLLDMSLKAVGATGETLGERLKNSRQLFSYEAYNAAWAGHKVRNQIAHETDFDLLHHQVLTAIENFKIALKDLRII